MAKALLIDAADHVATMLADVAAGEAIDADGRVVVARQPIARGHKVALAALADGADILKFGVPIGHATRPIAIGEHVHSHNLATSLSGTLDYRYGAVGLRREEVAAGTPPTFDGYVRADGRVGTRNEIWVLPTVGCVGRTAQRIAAAAGPRVAAEVNGVHAFAHPFGCSQLGENLSATRRMLAALADNPNAGGVLIVGLGLRIEPDRRADRDGVTL